MDISALLPPVSADAPSGPDYEDYANKLSAQLNAVEALMRGERKDATSVTMTVRWPEVHTGALELGKKGKHLRVATILVESACIIEGLGGLRDGLKLILEWCTQYWDTLQPREDREIGLGGLNRPAFLQRVREIALSNSVGKQFNYDDLEKARGDSSAEHGSDESNASRFVIAVFGDTKIDIHQENLTSAREALAHARAIEELFDERLGSGALNLADLVDLLAKIAKAVESFIPAKVSAEASAEAGTDSPEAAAISPAGNVAVSAINSRQSAVATLDKVIKYFEAAEPSSPVPLLLRRAQRCVGKDFMQLLEELGSQAEVILKSPTGLDDNENA